jgi:hypothetical protein
MGSELNWDKSILCGVFLPARAWAHPVSVINMVSEQIGRWGKQKSLRLSHTAGLALTESLERWQAETVAPSQFLAIYESFG